MHTQHRGPGNAGAAVVVVALACLKAAAGSSSPARPRGLCTSLYDGRTPHHVHAALWGSLWRFPRVTVTPDHPLLVAGTSPG